MPGFRSRRFTTLGVDGLSLFLVLLTTLLTPLSILASWKSIDQRVKGFLSFLCWCWKPASSASSYRSICFCFLVLGSDADPHVFSDRHLGPRFVAFTPR